MAEPHPGPASKAGSASNAPAKRPRRRFNQGEIRRIGAPKAYQRDPYFLLMEGSWAQFLGFLVGSFLAINMGFGLLYLLDPGGIANMREGSFVDAVAFSVQTMATIGYGFMAPTDTYTNVLVILQSVVGMMLTAAYTGLFFAKLSRPRSSVMFSAPALITRWDGRDVLAFRVANGRGNEVVEANIRVTVLVDAVDAEGREMRRLYDLTLVRDNSPLFTLSWTVMHVLDPLSPLFGVTPENAEEKMLAIICMMTAFDATYGQTTHARHVYMPEDLQFGRRYVDLITMDDQGRMQIDYARLDETVEDVAR